MYLKCDRIRDARKLFDMMPERDVVVWSAMVAGYSRLGLVDEAKEFFGENFPERQSLGHPTSGSITVSYEISMKY